MSQKKRENFFRYSTLVVDYNQSSLADLFQLHLSNSHLSFEDFINKNQHEIYHFCNNGYCCQCTRGYQFKERPAIKPVQLERLLDKNGTILSCHKTNRNDKLCCSRAKSGLTVESLDVSLLKFLLVNFCFDVFRYSCVTAHGLLLEDFLNMNKHAIFHLCFENTKCCCCNENCKYYNRVIGAGEWNVMFSTKSNSQCNSSQVIHICSFSVTKGIDQSQLAKFEEKLFKHLSPVYQAVRTLGEVRNNCYAHLVTAELSDEDFKLNKTLTENAILDISRVCGKHTEALKKLSDLEDMPLDERLFTEYQILLEEDNEHKKKIKKLEENLKDVHLKERAKQRKYMTDLAFSAVKRHVEENTFVSTGAVLPAIRCIEEKGYVIIVGQPGVGKSRTGVELMNQYCKNHSDYSMIKLVKNTELVAVIDTTDKCIVLCDDMFGENSCNLNEENLDLVLTYIETGNVKVIITMRESVRRSCGTVIQSHRLFNEEHFLDLSSDMFRMNQAEKRTCLLNYFGKNNIRETDVYQYENFKDSSIGDKSVTVFFHSQTIDSIVKGDDTPVLGFPEVCYLFSSHRKFTQQGATFFKHANERICDEIKRINKLDYSLLIYILLNGGEITFNDINMDEVDNLICTVFPQNDLTISLFEIQQCLKKLKGYFLKEDSNNLFSFQHRAIFEATLLSFSKGNYEQVIQMMDLDFIIDVVRPVSYPELKGDCVFTIPASFYSLLARRIFFLLTSKDTDILLIKKLCESYLFYLDGEHIVRYLCELHDKNDPGEDFQLGFILPWIRKKDGKSFSTAVPYFFPVALLLFCINPNMRTFLINYIGTKLESNTMYCNRCEKALEAIF